MGVRVCISVLKGGSAAMSSPWINRLGGWAVKDMGVAIVRAFLSRIQVPVYGIIPHGLHPRGMQAGGPQVG